MLRRIGKIILALKKNQNPAMKIKGRRGKSVTTSQEICQIHLVPWQLRLLSVTHYVQDIESTIHCVEWISTVGGSSTGEHRIKDISPPCGVRATMGRKQKQNQKRGERPYKFVVSMFIGIDDLWC